MTQTFDTTSLQRELGQDKHLRQLELEEACLAESTKRLGEFVSYLKGARSPSTDDHQQRSPQLSRTPAGHALLQRAVEPCAAALQTEINAALTGRPGPMNAAVRWLKDIPMESACVTALRLLMDGMDRPRLLVGLARAIGTAVFNEAALLAWVTENPALVRSVLAAFKSNAEGHQYKVLRAVMAREGVRLEIPGADVCVLVGSYIVHHLCKFTGFFDIVQRSQSRASKPLYVDPTPKLIAWVRDNHKAQAFYRPAYTPLLVEPKDWGRGADGGYHYALANSLPFAVGADRSSAKAIRDVCGPEPIAAINHMQRTAWRINRPIFELYSKVVLSGGNVGGLKALREHQLPPHPRVPKDRALWSDAQRDAHVRWTRAAAQIHVENVKARRRALREVRTLACAEQFLNEEEFYFACHYDFRGRLYYASPDLFPQGNDRHRALLEFARGAHLTASGRRALDLHGVARLGTCPFSGAKLSQCSISERLDWVRQHADDIQRVREAPLDHGWWEDADDPWQFLAYCLVEPDTVCHLPTQVDGTCNGYQHFAALSGDVRLAGAVNVEVAGDRPRDIYTEVAQRVLCSQGGTLQRLPAGVLLDRGTIKRPVMTVPYGATLLGMAAQIEPALGSSLRDDERRAWAIEIAKGIVAALKGLYPKVDEASAYISMLTKRCNSVEADLAWTSPSGFFVSQKYRKVAVKRVQVRLPERVRMELDVGQHTDVIEARSAIAGSVPNVLQSLDAAHMHKVAAEAARRGIPMASIHDCFMFHPNDAEAMGRIIREQFIETHREPFMERLRAMVSRIVDGELPPPPQRGALQLERVLESPFFFS